MILIINIKFCFVHWYNTFLWILQGALQFEIHYADLQPFPSSVQFLAFLQSPLAVARSLRLELSACGLFIQVCTNLIQIKTKIALMIKFDFILKIAGQCQRYWHRTANNIWSKLFDIYKFVGSERCVSCWGVRQLTEIRPEFTNWVTWCMRSVEQVSADTTDGSSVL